jgi:hypothetical protein
MADWTLLLMYAQRRQSGNAGSGDVPYKQEMIAWRRFLCRNVVIHSPNITVCNDGQFGSALQQAQWFSNFKNRQVFSAYAIRTLFWKHKIPFIIEEESEFIRHKSNPPPLMK